MRTIKPRKPRGIKQNGRRSLDLCPHCFSFGCDPMSMSPAFRSKIEKRLASGLCPACGQPGENCACRSSLSIKEPHIKTHDNRKKEKATVR